MAAAQTERGVPLSALCPKFLHTNSTSHTWPFSAIAELIDNAYDPDVNAKTFWIDKTVIKGKECLTFMDNGNGVNYDMMLKMLSFGYSDKTAVNGQEPIGIYGNGFKSGSMRLGRDALVFSKSKDALTIGMLSQSYLEGIKAEQIVVPIVGFEHIAPNKFCVSEEHKASLKDILRYSPFNTEVELLNELHAISSTCSFLTGTRIIIWNLRRTSTGTTEFDFVKDRYDIQIPSDVYETMSEKYKRPERFTSSIPESDFSLRAYCSILYLKPRMQIIIRGQKVRTQFISKSLAYIEKDHYKPNFLNKRIPITFGYNTKSKDQYGIMMYHKNRLIKAYERVGCQLKANFKGVGVIGVIECNFLDPTHNKQDFDNTDKYRRTINSLGIKLEEYWNEIRFKRDREEPHAKPVEETLKRPDQNWVQCDECLRWRKLPDGIDCSLLPDKWFCRNNPDPQFRSCQVDEEPEDSDSDQPSYRKTYKQHEREDKKKQECKQRRFEEEQKRRERERMAKLAQQNEHLRRLQENLQRQLSQTTVTALVRSPSTPDTPKSRVTVNRNLGGVARATASPISSTTLSQAACSPSTSSGLPIIASVCSLSTPSRMKRTQPMTPSSESKRPRVNGFHRSTPDTASPAEASPMSSTAITVIPLDDDDDDDDDDITDDDDIVILETGSTPVPKRPGFNLAKVKRERQRSDSGVGMLMECSDDAAVDAASETSAMGTGSTETAAVGTGPSPPPPPTSEQVSITTQTEVPKVKDEEEEETKRRKKNEDEKKQGEKEGTEQSTPQANEKGENRKVDRKASIEEREVTKPEGGGDANTEANSGNRTEETLTNGVAASHQSVPAVEAGPSRSDHQDLENPVMNYHTMNQAQEQQDQLLELMQAAAQERDSFKEQVHQLTCQLHDTETKMQELQARTAVKKESSHEATQTEEAEGEQNYKSLYERAKQEAEELRREKEALLAARQADAGTTGQPEEVERVSDEVALQVDCLLRTLDESNSEKDALRSKVESLEEEKKNLTADCEQLKFSLEEEKKKRTAKCEQLKSSLGGQRADAARDSTAQSTARAEEEAGGTGGSATTAASSEDQSKRLRELRQNVGRLLVSFVPALDLAQVNYECTVIDEILEQVTSFNSQQLPGVYDMTAEECRDIMAATLRSVSW